MASIAGVVSATGQNVTALSTPSRTTSPGCVLVACVEWYTAGATADCTISDSKGNTWVPVAASTVYKSSRRIKGWVCVPSTVGASHTFTATRGDATYTDVNIAVTEISGGDTASALDTAALLAATTGNSAVPSATTNALSAAETVLVAMLGWFGTPTFTEDAAWTNRANLDSGGDDEKMALATRIVTGSSAVTYAPTLSGATNWGALVIPIKASASNPVPTFAGAITAQNAAVGQALISYNVSAKFSDAGDTLTYSQGGTWPAGVSINSSTGVISGTPTTAGTYSGLTVIATDTASQTATSNAFSITVASSGVVTVRRTIGNTGDYTTIQAWNNAAPADLTTSNIIWQGECQAQEFVIAEATYSPNYAINITGSTADATRYKHLTAAPGASFCDNASRNLRYDATKGAAIRFASTSNAALAIAELGYRTSRLQIKHDGTGSACYVIWTTQLGKTIHTDCIFEGGSSNFVAAVSGTHDMIRCAVIGTNATSIAHIAEGSAGVSWYSCVIAAVGGVQATYGLLGGNNGGTADGTVDCNFINTAVFGCGSVREFNSPGTRSNCFTDAATRPTGFTQIAYDTTTGSGFVSKTAPTHDLRLVSTSALINAGTTDAVAGAVDIYGTSRPQGASYDVGPFEAPGSTQNLAGGAASSSSASGAASVTKPLAGGAAGSSSASGQIAPSVPLGIKPLKNRTGTVLPSEVVTWITCTRISDAQQIGLWTNVAADASGYLPASLSAAFLVAGQPVILTGFNGDGSKRFCIKRTPT